MMALEIPPATRPQFAQGYGINTSPDGLLNWTWVSRRMAESRNYWISTTRPNGNPHITPVWGVWLDEQLYFGGERQARRTLNLHANPHLCAHLESGDEVVIIEGVAEEVTDPDRLKQIGAASADKYQMVDLNTEESLSRAIYYRVRAQVVLAWLEQDYPNTATRWVFSA